MIHWLVWKFRRFSSWLKELSMKSVEVFPNKTEAKAPVFVFKASKEIMMKPKDTHRWNPIRKYPRNEICYCEAGRLANRKFKNCCLINEPLAVPKELADQAKPIVDKILSQRERT